MSASNPPSGRSRTTVLAQVLAAFASPPIKGNLSEADFEWGCAWIEREHKSDLEAAKGALCAELAAQQRAVALVVGVLSSG